MSARMTRGALERWAATPPAAHEAADVLMALIALGDALRLGIEIPAPLRGWMANLLPADVEAALAPLAAEVVGGGVRRLGDAESVQRAVMRIAMAKGWRAASIAPLAALRLASSRAKSSAAVPAEASSVTAQAELEPLADGSVRAAVPDDDIVLAYVRRGALARYVEGVALQNRAFAEELTASIDALIDSGEVVGDRARAWRGRVVAGRPTNVSSMRRRRWVAFGTLSLASVALLVAVGASYVAEQKEHSRILSAKDSELAELQAELDKLTEDLRKQDEAVALAAAALASAQSDADRRAAEAKLSAAVAEQRKTDAAMKARTSKRSPRAACTCQVGDPLCSCL